MQIKCPNCSKKIILKAGTFPENKKFLFLCPDCKHTIKYRPLLSKERPASSSRQEGSKLKKYIFLRDQSLPPVPDILQKAKAILESSGKTIKEFSAIVSLDPAISARVLRLANSAYFNISSSISAIEDACMLLGEQNLMSLVMIAEMSRMLGKEFNGYGIGSATLVFHSIAVAVASDIIARRKMPDFGQDAFSAGLFHDCGKMILNDYIYKTRDKFFSYLKDHTMKVYNAEKKIFGFSHAEIGCEILKTWKIPEIQTEAILYHHNPLNSKDNKLAYILNIADFIASGIGYSSTPFLNNEKLDIDKKILEFVSLEYYEIDEIRRDVYEKVKAMTEGFVL